MKIRDCILVIGGISFLLFVILLSLLLADKFQVQSCGCPKMVSHYFIYLFILLASLFIGSLIYYLLSLRIESKEKLLEKNVEILFSLLDESERNVLRKLVRSGGEMSQVDLNEEFGKLKAHRILKKLKEKNIINVASNGKGNTVRLRNELKEELVK